MPSKNAMICTQCNGNGFLQLSFEAEQAGLKAFSDAKAGIQQ